MFIKKSLAIMSLSTLALAPAFGQTNPELETITVYGSRFRENLTQLPSNTTIITSEEINKSGLNNIADIIVRLGNVTGKTDLNSENNLSFDLRGFGANADQNIVVLLDGMRLSENENTSAKTNFIPTELIERIEIVRGGNSVLYGDGANGGVINIITKKNVENLTTLSIGAGSYKTYDTELFKSHKFDDVQIMVFGKAFNTGGYRDQSWSHQKSSGIMVKKDFSGQDNLGFRLFASDGESSLPGAIPLNDASTNPKQAQYPGAYTPLNSNQISAIIFGEKYISNSTIFALETGVKKKDYSYQNYSSWGPGYYSTSYEAQNIFLNPRLKVNNFISSKNRLILGIDISNWERFNNCIRGTYTCLHSSTLPNGYNGKGTQTSYAAYIKNEYDISNRDVLILGARLETSKNTSGDDYWGNQTSRHNMHAFEAQYQRKLAATSLIYIKAGKNYRLPNVDNIIGAAYDRTTSWPILKPQTSNDYEIGLTGNLLTSKYAVTAFYSSIKNEIIYDPNANGGWTGNINLEGTERRGVEASISQKIDPFNFKTFAQIVDTKNTKGAYVGKKVPGVAKYAYGLNIDFNPTSNQTLAFDTRVTDGQHAQSDFFNTEKMKAYSVSNFRYVYKTKGLTSTLSVNNIFDKNYWDTAVNDGYGGTTVYPSPRRNIYINLKYLM